LLPKVIGTAGLALDILGVILLFKYAVNRNPHLSPHGHATSFVEGTEKDEIAKREYLRFRSRESAGLAMLIIGFALQAVAVWWTDLTSVLGK
jgi:hypothetical protein